MVVEAVGQHESPWRKRKSVEENEKRAEKKAPDYSKGKRGTSKIAMEERGENKENVTRQKSPEECSGRWEWLIMLNVTTNRSGTMKTEEPPMDLCHCDLRKENSRI